MVNTNTPSAEEFNRKMGESVEYKKLVDLKEYLNWFRGKIIDFDLTELETVIDNRIKDIPKESINFTNEVHGSTTDI